MKKLMLIISDISIRLFGKKISYKLRYFHNRGRWPNLKNPQDLSERIIAMILAKDFKKYADYADKVKVREYIKSKGLDHILLKHYAVWDDPKKIEIDSLPEKFILKANNGCGNHFICKDKSKFDLEYAKSSLEKTLNIKYKYETHYNAIKPLVFAEELLDTGNDSLPTDYKFTCVAGKVDHILCVLDRKGHSYKLLIKDTNWNTLPYLKDSYLPSYDPKMPNKLKEMVEIAGKLCEDFEFVRVDLYEHEDKIYFGELTFSPLGGIISYYTDESLKIIGDKFNS